MPVSRTSISAAGMGCAAGSDSASAGVAKRFLQQVEPALQQRVVDREGDENANDVSVDTAREEDEAAVTRGGCHRLGQVGRRLGELEGEHWAEAAHLSDGCIPGCEKFEAGPDPGAELVEIGRASWRERVWNPRDGVSIMNTPGVGMWHCRN